MGVSYLSRVCAAVLFAAAITPALAATDKPNYFYNAATKTWIPARDAVITPQGTIINNSAAAQAQRFLDGQGGFVNKSTVHANFPAVKKTVPITIDAKTPSSKVKLGAKSLLKGGVAGIVLGAGLQQLLDGVDWVMTEGGKVASTKVSLPPSVSPSEGSVGQYTSDPNGTVHVGNQWSSSACVDTEPQYCYATNGNRPLVGVVRSGVRQWSCPVHPDRVDTMGCVYGSADSDPFMPTITTSPVPQQDIDNVVDSSYVPTLDDWDWLAPYMDPTAIEITDPPRLMSPPVTKTIYDADGNPVQISETNIWHDFDIRNNDSTQPEIDVKTTEETKVYEGGTLVSTNTTTSTSAADPDASTSGGDDFEIPTDCDFMPTVCAFIDWFKDDDLGDDPDLKSIMKDDEDFARSKTISFGAAVCPAPHTINLPSLGMSVDLSFEFFCQFAEYARALVLAAAYIFAAYISLGVARG